MDSPFDFAQGRLGGPPHIFLPTFLRIFLGCAHFWGNLFPRQIFWGRGWQDARDRVGYGFSVTRNILPMTNRVVPAPQDFQKMCKQAERDHESKKLVVLMDRVKRQIAERNSGVTTVEGPKPPVTALNGDSGVFRLPSRSAIFER
jgi:hypothetical protein